MDKILRNVAGRTVIDPFMGSGSTGVATIGAGRMFTGIEKNPVILMTVSPLRAAHRLEAGPDLTTSIAASDADAGSDAQIAAG